MTAGTETAGGALIDEIVTQEIMRVADAMTALGEMVDVKATDATTVAVQEAEAGAHPGPEMIEMETEKLFDLVH